MAATKFPFASARMAFGMNEGAIVRPSDALKFKSEAVKEVASRYKTTNARVFGSVVHGTDEEGSDIDILVDALPGTTLFDLGGLQVELEDLLGVPVDLLTPGDLPDHVLRAVLAEARAL